MGDGTLSRHDRQENAIVNDANLWATETMGTTRYPFELLRRIITVSLETNKIIDAPPRLVIESMWYIVGWN